MKYLNLLICTLLLGLVSNTTSTISLSALGPSAAWAQDDDDEDFEDPGDDEDDSDDDDDDDADECPEQFTLSIAEKSANSVVLKLLFKDCFGGFPEELLHLFCGDPQTEVGSCETNDNGVCKITILRSALFDILCFMVDDFEEYFSDSVTIPKVEEKKSKDEKKKKKRKKNRKKKKNKKKKK